MGLIITRILVTFILSLILSAKNDKKVNYIANLVMIINF